MKECRCQSCALDDELCLLCKASKTATVGDVITCPECGAMFRRESKDCWLRLSAKVVR